MYTRSYVTRISSRSLFSFFFYLHKGEGKKFRVLEEEEENAWAGLTRNKSNIASPPSPIRRLSRDLRLNGR